jgi:pSer/pThr/pTyr-binding forkhead associated (FHA) protein
MIPVKCPHCKVGLKVDEQKLPKGINSFKCPKCNWDISISALEKKRKSRVVSEEVTMLRQPVRKGDSTLTIAENADTPAQTFLLQEGLFIIGRKVSVAQADICIETEDKSMSRSHMRIESKKSPQGGLIYSLSDNKSKNRTMYNGRYLDEGEVIVLKNNDEIVIGHTLLRFND